jgi:hypothetical protein
MKTPCLTAAAIALLSVILLPACEPGAQSNVVPGDRESSGADNSLESTGTGQGASPDQVPGEPQPR